MPRTHLAIALLFCPALALGQSGGGLVPEDASFALVVNSVSGLKDRGEKFAKDHGIKLGEWDRPTTFLKNGFDHFGLKKGIDEKGPAAVVLPNLSTFPEEETRGFLGILNPLYGVFPVKDAAEVAGNYGLKADELKGGKIKEVTIRKKPHYIMLKGKHVYVAELKRSLTLASAARPLSGAVGAAQKAVLAKSDVALYFGARALGKIWGNWLDSAEKNLKSKDARDDSQAKALVAALRQLRFVVGGLSLDEGGKINVIATFKTGKDGEAAKKFLTTLRAGPGASDLVGLPKGQPLFVFAAKGDGTSNVAMARALVNFFIDQGRIDMILPGEERREFIASFEKLYKELKGSRAALYHNGDPTKQGRLALVGILDVGDTEKHLAEMPNLVKRLNKAFGNAFGKKAPVVSYEGKAEKLDGLDVNLLRIKAADLSVVGFREPKTALGPDWDKIRIAVVGKKVVFLVGSNKELLKEAIANLKKGNKGLAADKTATSELGRVSKARKIELHFNLEGLALLNADKKVGPVRGLTTFALTVEPDYLQLEIVAAKSEVKPFAERFGLGIK